MTRKKVCTCLLRYISLLLNTFKPQWVGSAVNQTFIYGGPIAYSRIIQLTKTRLTKNRLVL